MTNDIMQRLAARERTRDIDPDTRRFFEGLGWGGLFSVCAWLLFFAGLYLVTPA